MAKTSAERVAALRERRKKLAGPALETVATSLRPPAPETGVAQEGVREPRVTRAEFERGEALRKAQELRLCMLEDEMALLLKRVGHLGEKAAVHPLAGKPDQITRLREQLNAVVVPHSGGPVVSEGIATPHTSTTSVPVPRGYNPLLSVPEDPTDFSPA